MKMQEVQAGGRKVVQVYVTQSEKNSQAAAEEIHRMREKSGNVVVFFAGEKKAAEVLKEMIRISANF